MTPDYRQNGSHGPRGATLECRTEVVSECSVVHVSGEVDLATVHILKDALDAAILAPHPIIIDFAATRYVDSATIHVLLRTQERHHKTLAVAALGPTLKRIFDLTKVAEVIPLYETLAEALATECTASSSAGTSRP